MAGVVWGVVTSATSVVRDEAAGVVCAACGVVVCVGAKHPHLHFTNTSISHLLNIISIMMIVVTAIYASNPIKTIKYII